MDDSHKGKYRRRCLMKTWCCRFAQVMRAAEDELVRSEEHLLADWGIWQHSWFS
jgi:hypothetical protein